MEEERKIKERKQEEQCNRNSCCKQDGDHTFIPPS